MVMIYAQAKTRDCGPICSICNLIFMQTRKSRIQGCLSLWDFNDLFLDHAKNPKHFFDEFTLFSV